MAIKEDLQFYDMCLRAHGHTFLRDHVDGDKSESDEESRSMKPPPIPYSQFKHKIVKIPDIDADSSKIKKRKNNLLNDNITKSNQLSKVKDKDKKLTNNKAEVVQKNDLNKNNHKNSTNTEDNPRTLIIDGLKRQTYSQCVTKLKVTNEAVFNEKKIQAAHTATVPKTTKYLLEKCENSMTQRLPSTPVESPCTFGHENITLPSNVNNLSRRDGDLKVKTTGTNRSAISTTCKPSAKATILKNVNVVDQSQIQITQMPKDYLWLEKRESTPYPELPSTSRVPYNPFAVKNYKSTAESPTENLRSGASKRESAPYPDLPSISRMPYNPYENNSIKVGHNLEQNHHTLAKRSATENCRSEASKRESTPYPELPSTSRVPYNPFGYDVSVENYLQQNCTSIKGASMQNSLSTDKVENSQFPIPSKTKLSKNNSSSQKENTSEAFASIDSIFTSFQKKRNHINKKKCNPICVVM